MTSTECILPLGLWTAEFKSWLTPLHSVAPGRWFHFSESPHPTLVRFWGRVALYWLYTTGAQSMLITQGMALLTLSPPPLGHDRQCHWSLAPTGALVLTVHFPAGQAWALLPAGSLCGHRVGQVQMSADRCGVQAQETPRPGWAGLTSTPTSGLESQGPGVHCPCCPPATHNRQQVGGSCFIWNRQGPLSWLPHTHPGPGESRGWGRGVPGNGGARGSSKLPQRQAGRRQICPRLPLALLSARTVWVGCSGSGPSPLSPTQLRLLELQEAPLYRASWMAWKWRPHDGQN